MTLLRVETDHYRSVYGRQPRGHGRWWFSLGRSATGQWFDIDTNGPCFWSEAKRWALASARQMGGVDRVILNP